MIRLLICLMSTISVLAFGTSPTKVKTLYDSLEPKSVTQHLAFYQLYSQYPQGKQALRYAWKLLGQSNDTDLPSFDTSLNNIIGIINKQANEQLPELNDEALDIIDSLAQHLQNRKLKGYFARSEEEVLALDSQEIDLARGVFLTEFGSSSLREIQTYEAYLDLMALQILTRITMTDTPQEKIRAINHYVFEEMGFRFPPQSHFSKDIDQYTFLPAVLNSRKGVCLGVSILYMSLAQRLGLPLEMVTPPGHIYVRYRNGDEIINIETTARGIDIDSEEYLGIENHRLQQRSIKEVIGLTHFNDAAGYWRGNNHDKALASYHKAHPYVPDDPLLKEFMAYNYILNGDEEKGRCLLEEIVNLDSEYSTTKNTIPIDFLNGHATSEGLRSVFMDVEQDRPSLLKKLEALQQTVEQKPHFRGALFHLAITHLQMHRLGEALSIFEKYHELDQDNPSVEYFLAAINVERLNYNISWRHYHHLSDLLKSYKPKELRLLQRQLLLQSPE